MTGSGAFVVAWESQGQDGSGYGVFARRFSSAGAALASEFRANDSTSNTQNAAAVAINTNGSFVIVWRDAELDGSGFGVFAQRFQKPLAILDIDGNGVVEPLTDSLLVLRFTFGFTGNTLVTGAVDLVGCTRCTAPTIEAYLTTLK
jgi:hypothetical protein